MARKGAALKSTSGEGFEFADRVAAGFLMKMLSMGFPLGSDDGHLVGLDWEVKASGWHLDDLLLRLRTRERERFCAISVKSNDQLNSNGFSASFAADAWDQWRPSPDNPFVRGRDFLGLAVSRLASGVEKAWKAIERRGTPADRLAVAIFIGVLKGNGRWRRGWDSKRCLHSLARPCTALFGSGKHGTYGNCGSRPCLSMFSEG